jgi:hypothetical protein
MSKEHLSNYLNDHLAGSVVAIEVLERLAEDAADLRPFVTQLKKDIEADQSQLVRLMERLDIEQSRLRKAGGWIAEHIAEAKLEMDDPDSGDLRRLERLEALVLGIAGKSVLWRGLEAASAADERLRGPDYEQLSERAREQLQRVEKLRIAAARSALTLAA